MVGATKLIASISCLDFFTSGGRCSKPSENYLSMKVDLLFTAVLCALCFLSLIGSPNFASSRQPAIFGSPGTREVQRKVVNIAMRFGQGKISLGDSKAQLANMATSISDVSELKELVYWCHFSASPVVSESIMREAVDAFIHRLGRINSPSAILVLRNLYESGDFGATTDFTVMHTYHDATGKGRFLKKSNVSSIWIKDFCSPLSEAEMTYLFKVRTKLHDAWKRHGLVSGKNITSPIILDFTVDDRHKITEMNFCSQSKSKPDQRSRLLFATLEDVLSGYTLPAGWQKLHCRVWLK